MKITFCFCVAITLTGTIALSQNDHCTDAEILALEYSQLLSPPQDMTDLIDADLQAVRNYDGFFEDFRVLANWMPSELYIHFTPEAMQEFLAGSYHGFDELNEQYGPAVMRTIGLLNYIRLTLEPCYSPQLLEPLYREAPGVINVLLINYDILDGHDIDIQELGRYLYRYGWMDCESGCIYRHYWVIDVNGSAVEIVDEYGDELATQSSTWGGVKSEFR